MTIATSFYSFLTASSAIEALVSDDIFPHYRPQYSNATRFLTYSQDTGEYIEHLAGRSGTRKAEFTVDCYDDDYPGSKDLAETVQSELVGVRGTFGADTAESIRLLNEFDVPPENETGLYRTSLRFEVAYY